MLDRRRHEELEGALALGRLADRMIFALGRATRKQPLQPEDKPAVAAAQKLFDLMATEDVIVLGTDTTASRMLNDDSYLEALHVFQLKANGGDLETRAQRYRDLLQKVYDQAALTEEERDVELIELRDLFDAVGETTLVRAGELSRERQEPPWRLMRPTTLSF